MKFSFHVDLIWVESAKLQRARWARPDAPKLSHPTRSLLVVCASRLDSEKLITVNMEQTPTANHRGAAEKIASAILCGGGTWGYSTCRGTPHVRCKYPVEPASVEAL